MTEEAHVARAGRRDRRTLPWIIALIVGSVLLFCGVTVGYVTWSVNTSQHRWCSTLTLLNEAPAPAGAPERNPSRAYDQLLAADFRQLKASLGC